MHLKTGLTGAAFAMGLAVMAGPANAASVLSLLNSGSGAAGSNTLVDDNREYLIDRVGNTTGQIDVGDSIRGLAIWSKLNGHALGEGTSNNELTAVFQVRVTGKTLVSPGVWDYSFGPDSSFAEASALGLGGRAMMVFYEDATPDAALDYNDPGSPLPANSIDDGTTFNPPSSEDVSVAGANVHEEAFIGTATNGSFFWAIGFTGTDADGDGIFDAADGEGWEIEGAGTDNMLDFFDIDSGNDLASANFSLNRTLTAGLSGTGESLALAKKASYIDSSFNVEFNGSSTLEGIRNELTPFEASSQSTVTFARAGRTNVIPLPASAWMGLVLLGGIGMARLVRRRTVDV